MENSKHSPPVASVALAALSLALFAARPGSQPVGTQEGLADARLPIGLAELADEPDVALLGEHVSLTLQFDGLVEEWNPYLSRFAPAGWLGFTAWADETFTWEREVYLNPSTRLFVRRGSAEEATLRRAKRFERFHVQATLREVFLDEPWLEVSSVERSPEFVPEGTILHMGRAKEFEAKGQFELAVDQMERAANGPLPPHALLEIGRRVAACREAERLLEAKNRRER